MVKKCEIKFKNNRNGVYFTGQTLEGSVELVLDEPKKVRSFYIEVHGFAHASWNESRAGNGNSRRSVTCTGKEDYLCAKTVYVGSLTGQREVEIATGTHTYNFQCFLPLGMPTSFEGEHGHIRYTVKAILDRPWTFDQTSKVAFTVIRQVDLNQENPGLRLPSQMEILKRFCCWPCQSAPLILTVQLPMSGYAPGQCIDISGELINKSSVTVNSIYLALKKTITYFSEAPRSEKKERLIVRETGVSNFAEDGCTKFKKGLIIPPVTSTNLTQSKIIHQIYELIVEARVSGCNKNPKFYMPITIGTVPLRQKPVAPVAPAATSVSTAPGSKSQPFVCPTPAAPPLDHNCEENTNFLELPPPTYEECATAGPIAIEGANENPISTKAFTPKYPTYDYGWDTK